MKALFLAIVLAIVFGCIGAGAGYGVFGHIRGRYIPPEVLFADDGHFGRIVLGTEDKRMKIIICGAGASLLGFVVGLATMSGSRNVRPVGNTAVTRPRPSAPSPSPEINPDVKRTLDMRLISGEISEEEYKSKIRMLRNS